jgi:hypothetical protein
MRALRFGARALIERQTISPERKDGRRDPNEALVSELLLVYGQSFHCPWRQIVLNPRAHPANAKVASTDHVLKPVLPFAEPFLAAECSWVFVPLSASPRESISRRPALRVRSRACMLPEASR